MTLVVCGYGYSAEAFVRAVRGRFGRVVATVRSAEKAERLRAEGIEVFLFPGEEDAVARALQEATAVLVSVPPGEGGDPVLARFGDDLRAAAGRIGWLGYLSTVGVYGDHAGGLVDEGSALKPVSRRSRWRVVAEEGWLRFGREAGIPVAIFRLAGIYGPGRSPLDKVRDGSARRIVKPGQVFNRIHRDDIAAALAASLARPRAGAIYNVSDDEPAPPGDVIAFAASLLGREPPPEVPFGEAELSPMGLSFWGECKRVSNRLLADELGVRLRYPTYREGLRALLAAEDQAGTTFNAGPNRSR